LLSTLSPYSSSSHRNTSHDVSHSETLPINAIPLFATSNSGYQTILTNSIATANKVYQEFISSKEGKHFAGQVRTRGKKERPRIATLCSKVIIIGDANGAILAYDALCMNHNFDDTTSLYGEGNFVWALSAKENRSRILPSFSKDASTPRTPGLSKRLTNTGQHDSSDTTSIQSSNRQSIRRTDYGDLGDSM
jgi:hypothetical protein